MAGKEVGVERRGAAEGDTCEVVVGVGKDEDEE